MLNIQYQSIYGQLIQQGGIILIILAICSVFSLYVILERFLVIFLAKHSFKQFFTTLTFNLRKKDYDAALLSCSEKKDPIGKLFLMAIERRGKSKEVIEEAMQRNTITVTGFLERRLQVLATIGSTAPFIGLLGTVFGIIKTFNGLSLIQYAFSSNIITSGISQALINTAAGLIVSIPALIAYNYFVTKINGFLQEIEVASSEVVELLTEQ